VWLDYSRADTSWDNHVAWAANLGFYPNAINLDPAYTTTIDWSTGWRLPTAGANPQGGFETSSEWGHLRSVSLDQPEGYLLPDGTGPFSWLPSSDSDELWTGTEIDPLLYPSYPNAAWAFDYWTGRQVIESKNRVSNLWGMAVHPGEVSIVPIPGAMLLFGSGLIGLIGCYRGNSSGR
jgi:hypothetical protein